MPKIQLNEQVFETAQRRAVDAGYSSVEEYITDFVVHDQVDDMAGQTPDLDHLFTADRLAHIDAAMAEIKAGQSFMSRAGGRRTGETQARMASKKPGLRVTLSPTAIDELDGIWQWNAKQYEFPRADKYLAFLTDHIKALADDYARGARTSARAPTFATF